MIENMTRMGLSRLLFAAGRLIAHVGFDISESLYDVKRSFDAVGGKVRRCGCESVSPTGCWLLVRGTRGSCQCACHTAGER
jgi:hypothetical protein